MKNIKFCSRIAVTLVLTSIAFTNVGGKAWAQQVLESNQTLNGRIDSSSNPVGVQGGQFRPGVEYSFEARVGDEIRVTALRQEGSNIDVVLVVLPPGLSPIQLDNDFDGGQRETYYSNAVSSGGLWKIRVVSFNNQAGNFQLTLEHKRNGVLVTKEPQLPFADEVMKKINLRATACSTPDVVAVIDIAGERRCTTDWPKGEYIYDQASNSLIAKQPADANLALLKSWGLTTTSCGTQVVSILIDGKQYCTLPNANLGVGSYSYNSIAKRLSRLRSSPPPSPRPNPPIAPRPNPIDTTNTGGGRL